jgi:integrase
MQKIDQALENWLTNVAISHSDSEPTKRTYNSNIIKFLTYANTTVDQIVEDYNKLPEKEFKQKYTTILTLLIGEMKKNNYGQCSLHNVIATVKSCFKYNNLPLNFMPSAKQFTKFHNRDITKEEIEQIIKEAEPREKAYYALMVQSGLRPQTISKLKIENIENLLEQNTPIPCLIKIPQEATKGKYYEENFSFTSTESIKYIKEYLKRERNQQLKPNDYLFTRTKKEIALDPDTVNHLFHRTAEKLRQEHILNFETDTSNLKGKTITRNKLKLYSLRKYFRKQATPAGDHIHLWMQHEAKLGVDKHYISRDIEHNRTIYKEKAMPYLRIESKTPDQNEQKINELIETLKKEHQKEIETIKNEHQNEDQKLRKQIDTIQTQLNKVIEFINKNTEFTTVQIIDKIPEEGAENKTIPEKTIVTKITNDNNIEEILKQIPKGKTAVIKEPDK